MKDKLDDKKRLIKIAKPAMIGFLAGTLNGLLGAGGGIIVVPLLQKAGLTPDKSHATSIAIILPLCIMSATLYLIAGKVQLGDSYAYLPGGLIGACFGAWLLTKVPANLLRRLFALVMIYSAIKILIN